MGWGEATIRIFYACFAPFSFSFGVGMRININKWDEGD